jgi:signal transduction histidine kinase
MERIRNLSFRTTLVLYTAITAVCCVILCSVLINSAYSVRNTLYRNYYHKYFQTEQQFENYYDVNPLRITIYQEQMSSSERMAVNICDFIETWSLFIVPGIGIVVEAALFYRNKLKKPLEALKKGADRIGSNDLDFTVPYHNKDELGQLCDSFEKMRLQLLDNQRQMWAMVEERKKLNAAFAHDLRTPLTVLRGYADLLKGYIPQGRISQEKLMDTLDIMSDYIGRLERYVGTMKEAQSLDQIEPEKIYMNAGVLADKLEHAVNAMGDRRLSFIRSIKQDKILLADEAILLEVAENLVGNALRYAVLLVRVEFRVDEWGCRLIVTDDGRGFDSEELEMAGTPYYRGENKEPDKKHYGMGLYICHVLCEKHGGFLKISNQAEGGARLEAVF